MDEHNEKEGGEWKRQRKLARAADIYSMSVAQRIAASQSGDAPLPWCEKAWAIAHRAAGVATADIPRPPWADTAPSSAPSTTSATPEDEAKARDILERLKLRDGSVGAREAVWARQLFEAKPQPNPLNAAIHRHREEQGEDSPYAKGSKNLTPH